MSFIHGTVGVSHPSRPELQGFEVSALADSGAVHLCIPEHIANQLQLRELEQREEILADGHRYTVPCVRPNRGTVGMYPHGEKGSPGSTLTWLPEMDPR